MTMEFLPSLVYATDTYNKNGRVLDLGATEVGPSPVNTNQAKEAVL